MDRNIFNIDKLDEDETSLSARRAWIEIWENARIRPAGRVALRKESVDRNADIAAILTEINSRSPQGERG